MQVESDSTGSLHSILKNKASSPIMNAFVAEICLELEAQGQEIWCGRHVSGTSNFEADALSRIAEGKHIPERFATLPRRAVPSRSEGFFRAWPRNWC